MSLTNDRLAKRSKEAVMVLFVFQFITQFTCFLTRLVYVLPALYLSVYFSNALKRGR